MIIAQQPCPVDSIIHYSKRQNACNNMHNPDVFTYSHPPVSQTLPGDS